MAGLRVYLNLRNRTPVPQPRLPTIQKCVIDQITLGNSIVHVWRAGTMGGPKGSSKNMTVGKEGKEKLDSIKGGEISKWWVCSVGLQYQPSREHGGTWVIETLAGKSRGGCTIDKAVVWISLVVGAGDPLGDFNRQGSDSPDVPPAVRAQLLGADWGWVTGGAWTRVKSCVRRGSVFQAIIVLFPQTDWLFGKLACSLS